MFRSSTIIRDPALNLAKVIFTLKHSVKLRSYLLCGCVVACHGMECVLYDVQNAQHTTHTLWLHTSIMLCSHSTENFINHMYTLK